jgi:DNA repair exonuclease SbcCD ATPase subunit
VVASAADVRTARKAIARIERRLGRIAEEEAALHEQITADPTAYEQVAELDARLRELAAEREELETEWLEAAETAG